VLRSLEGHIWKALLAVNTLSRNFRKSVRQGRFRAAGQSHLATAPALGDMGAAVPDSIGKVLIFLN
jgi:hypothetical protein